MVFPSLEVRDAGSFSFELTNGEWFIAEGDEYIMITRDGAACGAHPSVP